MTNERINRGHLLKIVCLSIAIQIFGLVLSFVVMGSLKPADSSVLAIATFFLAYYVKLVGVIKRLHDLPARFSFLLPFALLPYVNITVVFALLVMKGEPSTNAYGGVPTHTPISKILFSDLPSSLRRLSALPWYLNTACVLFVLARMFMLSNYISILFTQTNILGAVMSDATWGYAIFQLLLMVPTL